MRFFLKVLRRKPKSIEDQLELIKENIKQIEEKRKLNLSNEKHLIGTFLLYSFITYFTCVTFTIIYFKPTKTIHWFLYFALLIAFPFLIFYIKKIIHWFYIRRLGYVDKKLVDLKKSLKSLLTDVIEKETYKRANELLNKFDPDFDFRNEYENFPKKKLRSSSDHNSDSELDKKNLIKKSGNISETLKTVSVCDLRPSREYFQKSKPVVASEIKLIRPLLNQNRTVIDKLIDFIVGDGFDHRYALICKHCSSHNGMALAEEFPFIGFKCAYCLGFNTARKTKPDPPKIFNDEPIPESKIHGIIIQKRKGFSDENIVNKESTDVPVLDSVITRRLRNSGDCGLD